MLSLIVLRKEIVEGLRPLVGDLPRLQSMEFADMRSIVRVGNIDLSGSTHVVKGECLLTDLHTASSVVIRHQPSWLRRARLGLNGMEGRTRSRRTFKKVLRLLIEPDKSACLPSDIALVYHLTDTVTFVIVSRFWTFFLPGHHLTATIVLIRR